MIHADAWKGMVIMVTIDKDNIRDFLLFTHVGAVRALSPDVVAFVRNIKSEFTINELCRLLCIDRNRYYYLLKTNNLDWYIARLGGYVGEETRQGN